MLHASFPDHLNPFIFRERYLAKIAEWFPQVKLVDTIDGPTQNSWCDFRERAKG